ncbi:MAG: class A beta-lactamase-related serine hydrolase [Alphaproteobacteria bacterium]|nr:class A beta-lactamase-related serine hydrolase [Alphaproteobacteria bacterium]
MASCWSTACSTAVRSRFTPAGSCPRARRCAASGSGTGSRAPRRRAGGRGEGLACADRRHHDPSGRGDIPPRRGSRGGRAGGVVRALRQGHDRGVDGDDPGPHDRRSPLGPGAGSSARAGEDLATHIQAIADRATAVGAIVALARANKTTIVATAGLADAASDRAFTADTPWPIASVTKLFTAVVALQPVREGALNLDAPFRPGCPSSRTRTKSCCAIC